MYEVHLFEMNNLSIMNNTPLYLLFLFPFELTNAFVNNTMFCTLGYATNISCLRKF